MTEQSGESPYSKTDVLQVLLDTQVLAGDLFDAVEADAFRITPDLLRRLAIVSNRLSVLHQSMVAEYVLSGRAGGDLVDQLRADFGGPNDG